jgi:hypothetical protein
MDRLLYLLPVLVCPGRDGPDDVADTARRPPRRVANRCNAGRRGARRARPAACSGRNTVTANLPSRPPRNGQGPKMLTAGGRRTVVGVSETANGRHPIRRRLQPSSSRPEPSPAHRVPVCDVRTNAAPASPGHAERAHCPGRYTRSGLTYSGTSCSHDRPPGRSQGVS